MFRLKNNHSEIFVPDGSPVELSLKRTTHMGIGAHQDDLEIMALHGILNCFGERKKHFFGVTVTDGSGKPRNKHTAGYSKEKMRELRNLEQKKAAALGWYSGCALLGYPSRDVKNPKFSGVKNELKELIGRAMPEVIYTHNLADSHDTHVAVALRVIQALRELSQSARPKKVYGCEVWKSLDWMTDKDKIVLDVSGREHVSSALLGVFDSQIFEGKRYDLAAAGRRRANATFYSSRRRHSGSGAIFAMDLTPLIKDESLDLKGYVNEYMDRFRSEISDRIDRLG